MSTLQTYAEGTSGPPRKLKHIIPFLFTLVISMGLIHYFVFIITTRSVHTHSIYYKIISGVFIFGVILMPFGFLFSERNGKWLKSISWYSFVWMGFLCFLFFFSLIEILINVSFPHSHSYWILGSSFTIAVWSLYRGLAFPKIVTYELENIKLKNFSLVQISDLHIGMHHLRGPWLEKVVKSIQDLKPQALAITGDLIESRYKFIAEDLKILKELKSIPYKFYITGNHEYIHGGQVWETKLKELGFTVLHNTHKIINLEKSKLMIAGVPDRMIKRFQKKMGGSSDPDAALESSEEVDYKILLAHQPSSFYDLKKQNCDLILSGHTHGGQIFPFHIFVRLSQPVVAGFRKIKTTLIFAHQGTGLWGPPMRWFSQNEIVLFRWK